MDLEIGYLSKYNDEEIYVSHHVFRRKVKTPASLLSIPKLIPNRVRFKRL